MEYLFPQHSPEWNPNRVIYLIQKSTRQPTLFITYIESAKPSTDYRHIIETAASMLWYIRVQGHTKESIYLEKQWPSQWLHSWHSYHWKEVVERDGEHERDVEVAVVSHRWGAFWTAVHARGSRWRPQLPYSVTHRASCVGVVENRTSPSSCWC